MINITKHPDRVMAAASAPVSDLFIVVDVNTGRPQHFSVNTVRKESLGEFMDASSEKLSYLPAGIFDRETALYLIGQSYISATIDIDTTIKDGGLHANFGPYNRIYQPSFILVPVYGSALSIPSPSIDANEL